MKRARSIIPIGEGRQQPGSQQDGSTIQEAAAAAAAVAAAAAAAAAAASSTPGSGPGEGGPAMGMGDPAAGPAGKQQIFAPSSIAEAATSGVGVWRVSGSLQLSREHGPCSLHAQRIL
jgi:hypothetical protein